MQRLSRLICRARELGKQDSVSDAEISAFALNLLTNYRKNNSALKSLQESTGSDPKYRKFAAVSRKYLLSNLTAIERAHFEEPNLNMLLGIVHIGITTGADITKNLEDFLEWIDAKIERENRVRSKVSGMQVLSLLGIVFFFPLFSGITASIVRSSLTGPAAASTVTGLRLIGIGYVLIATLITNSLLNPSRGLIAILKSSLPMAFLGCALQTIAYTFSSYAI
ncbi:MAG: hypothetical protein KGH54_02105 [Candidatus Micrarchaeota archaeon]|nr:hypothetical protein [Candidatus Micrarchaeota archaeon]